MKASLIKLSILLIYWPAQADMCGMINPLELQDHASNRLVAHLDKNGLKSFWDGENQFQLTYCIDDAFKKEKTIMLEAMNEAVAQWEQAANVKFTHLPEEDSRCKSQNTNVLFRVSVVNSRRVPWLAKAFFPDWEQSKRRVVFKRLLFKQRYDRILQITLHELGHVLGFRHEHIHPDNETKCKENSPFEPITEYDPSSIMMYPRCAGNPIGPQLSDKDKQGAAIAYPFD